MAKTERQSNIELLRILAIMGVIILHYNNPVMGGGIVYVDEGSLNFYILYILESIFACAVNLFILISGFFLCSSCRRNVWRVFELLFQVIVFKEALYLVRVTIGSIPFSIKHVVTAMIPANYFVIIYCAVFVLSPFVNVMIDGLTDKGFRTLVLLCLLVFSVYPTVVDFLAELRGEEFIGLSTIGMYGSQWGYTFINFMLMYLVGAYLRRKIARLKDLKRSKLCLILFCCITIVVLWARINDRIGFFTERTAWEYCNPFIIVISVIIFILFNSIDLGAKRIINVLADGAFSVFLLHSIFLSHLQIEKYVKGNTILMLFHIIICATGLYLICWCVHRVYHFISDPIFKNLSRRFPLNIDVESKNGEKN